MRLPARVVARLREHYEGHSACVTGGAGFIGGHLVDALLSVGARVTVIDDLSNSTLDHLGELIDMDPERVRFVHGSILDPDALKDAAEDSLTLFHLAALGSVPRSMAEPERTWQVNATGTLRVLEGARRHGVARVIFAASSSAYGGSEVLPQVETHPRRPMSPYAASKLAGEDVMTAWAMGYGLSTASLRFFNVFGPRQSADSPYAAVVASFARRLLSGEAPVIYGDGHQTRDMTFVSNAVVALLLAGAVDARLRGEVMNVGTGRRVTVRELARLMAARLGGAHLEPVFEAARPGDVRDSLADVSRARELIGYEPVASLEEGLDETLAWFRQSLAGAGGKGG
jgi:nucleoside-diphosphate-sugar epimerase